MSILRLPTEILALILLVLVSNDPPAFRRRNGRFVRTYSGWLRFLEVCRRFKFVAIGCGSAWAEACTQFPSLPRIVDTRAGQNLRRMVARLGYPMYLSQERNTQVCLPVNGFLNNLLEQGNLDFVHTMLFRDPYEVCQFARSLFLQASETGVGPKALRVLDLSYDQRGEHLLTSILALGRTSMLVCPVLKRVCLNGLWIPVSSNNLRELEIHMPKHFPRPSSKQLYTVIARHASQLQFLCLHDAFEQDEAEDSPESVVLAQLAVIDLAATIQEARHFLELIVLSPNIELVRLSIREGSDSAQLPSFGFLYGTYKKFRVFLDEDSDTLTIDAWRKTPVINFRTSAELRKRYVGPLGSDFSLVYEFGDSTSSWESVICSVTRDLRCSEPVELSLILPPSFSSSYVPGHNKWELLISQLGPVIPLTYEPL